MDPFFVLAVDGSGHAASSRVRGEATPTLLLRSCNRRMVNLEAFVDGLKNKG